MACDKFENFIRDLVLNYDSYSHISQIREKGLNLLLENAREEAVKQATKIPTSQRLRLGGFLLSESAWQQIQAELNLDHKIQAIKVLRQETGLGLKESKDLIDALFNPITQKYELPQ